jgi:hypothetical protein
MADIFREVDEEVRRDQAVAFWTKYQTWLIGGAIVIIAATAAWRVYVDTRQKTAEAFGGKYENALQLSRDGKSAEALAAFDDLAKNAPAGYRALAQLRAAAELAATDRAAAINAYDALAKDESIGSLFQDAAKLRAALLAVDTADAAEVEARLKPLAATAQPFRNSARELLALRALDANDLDAAGHWLDMIVTDNQAPADVRRRAEALLGLVAAGKPLSK